MELTNRQRFILALVALGIVFAAFVVVPIYQSQDAATQKAVLENRQVGLKNYAILQSNHTLLAHLDRTITDATFADLQKTVNAILRYLLAHGVSVP